MRPIRGDDADRLVRLHGRCSPRSLYRRFLTPVPRPIPAAVQRLANVDYVDRLALVALDGDGEIVGVARFDRTRVPEHGETAAEVGIIVADAWQGRGIGSALLDRLSDAARARGIDAFVAEVAGENRPMLGLLERLGVQQEARLEGGVYQVRVTL